MHCSKLVSCCISKKCIKQDELQKKNQRNEAIAKTIHKQGIMGYFITVVRTEKAALEFQ